MSRLRLWTMVGRDPSQVVKHLVRSTEASTLSRWRSGEEDEDRRRRRGSEDETAIGGVVSREW